MQHEIQAAIADLEQTKARLSELNLQMDAEQTSVKSKDRMIEATVDARGRLTDLSLRATKYRTLSPKELCARIVETVRAAQDKGERVAMERLASVAPGGVPIEDLFAGTLNLDAMFDDAVAQVMGHGATGTDGTRPSSPQDGGRRE